MIRLKTIDGMEVGIPPYCIKSINAQNDIIEISGGNEFYSWSYKTKLIEQDKEDYKDVLEKRYPNGK